MFNFGDLAGGYGWSSASGLIDQSFDFVDLCHFFQRFLPSACRFRPKLIRSESVGSSRPDLIFGMRFSVTSTRCGAEVPGQPTGVTASNLLQFIAPKSNSIHRPRQSFAVWQYPVDKTCISLTLPRQHDQYQQAHTAQVRKNAGACIAWGWIGPGMQPVRPSLTPFRPPPESTVEFDRHILVLPSTLSAGSAEVSRGVLWSIRSSMVTREVL